ncbi:hypothetical protein FRC11_003510, partial [Ceratobasidium sp. 423]
MAPQDNPSNASQTSQRVAISLVGCKAMRLRWTGKRTSSLKGREASAFIGVPL